MKKKDDFYTWLDQIAEKKASEWTKIPMKPLTTDEVYTEMLNDPTYNYKEFYEGQPFLANSMLYAPQFAHFSDYAKTMYHPTFSNESIYSGKVSDYNPYGIVGGSWNETGTEYTPSMSQLANYWNYNRTRDYLDWAEDHLVKINIPKYYGGKGDMERSKYYEYTATLGPSLYKAMQRRGIQNIEKFYDFAMKQMGSESSFGQSDAARYGFNFGGVKPHTDYIKYKSVDDYTDKWVDMMLRMYPNAVKATTPEQYVKGLMKNIEGYSYFKDSPKKYLDNIKYATTLGKHMYLFRKNNPNLFNPKAGVVDGNLQQPVYNQNGQVQRLVTVPIQQDIRTVLNPYLTIPKLPTLYPQPEPYDIQYNHGKSGIHINPNNRGKFNATKKRTGKTTEELSHSKSPLIRKRAIFAMNARKWKY